MNSENESRFGKSHQDGFESYEDQDRRRESETPKCEMRPPRDPNEIVSNDTEELGEIITQHEYVKRLMAGKEEGPIYSIQFTNGMVFVAKDYQAYSRFIHRQARLKKITPEDIQEQATNELRKPKPMADPKQRRPRSSMPEAEALETFQETAKAVDENLDIMCGGCKAFFPKNQVMKMGDHFFCARCRL